jgi:protein SOK2
LTCIRLSRFHDIDDLFLALSSAYLVPPTLLPFYASLLAFPLYPQTQCNLLPILQTKPKAQTLETACRTLFFTSDSLSLLFLPSPLFFRETEKLELPSISQVHTRGPADIPWYNHHAVERPLLSGDKLPALSLPTATQAPSRSLYQDPSGSFSSSARSSLSGVSAVQEPRSPPSSDLGNQSLDSDYNIAHQAYYPSPTSLGSMNQTQPYMDVHSHMSSAQPYASQGATAGTMSHYPYHQQPPVLQPASSYASSYSQYGYPNGVTSPPTGHPPPASSMGGQMNPQLLPIPGQFRIMRHKKRIELNFANHCAVSNHPSTAPGYGNNTGAPLQGYVYDPAGQVAPPGAKPRVTATLWEDEGSLCYQVEAKGVCVARREGKQ